MAPSKSKEKKETAKTNRRKQQTTSKAQPQSAASEGQTPAELADQLSKAKNRAQMYELVKGHGANTVPEFLKYVPESVRLPIPIRDARRFKIGNDEDFFPGQYMRMEQCEYIIAQAPTKKSHYQIWSAVQKDRVKLMMCLCNEEQMSNSEDSKCFPYFPTEPEQTMEVEQKRGGKFTLICKSREGLSMGATKYEIELTDSETAVEKISDDPNATNEKTRIVILFHMNTWSGQKPESGNVMEQAQNVALFFREVHKQEMSILRKSMENYVPPVMIQSFDGINRSAVAWVSLMLLREVEKRECFDVPNLMKSMMKWRPGSISTYYHFCFCMAVCLHIGKEVKWCENDCNNALKDLTDKFGQRKLNELGNLAV